MIVVPLEIWKQRFTGRIWEQVFHFLESLNENTCDYDMLPIQGREIFARVMSYPTRGHDEAILEAHNTYVDVQMSLENSEVIEWYPRGTLVEREAYDAARDVVLFDRPAEAGARVHNVPGIATILFPEDAHMAQLAPEGKIHEVKKVVVKVRTNLVRPC